MNQVTQLLRGCALLGVLAASANLAAQASLQTYPSDPSTADDITIGRQIFSGCSYGPGVLVEIQTTDSADEGTADARYYHTLDIDLTNSGVVCASPIPPDMYEGYGIGRLPKGRHTITVRWVENDETVSETDIYFRVSDIASKSVSGAWYAPEQSGRGVFVIRAPLADGQYPGENLFIVYWANHDADGNPTWALMSGQMSDNIVSGTAINTTGTPLAPGNAELIQQPWGTASFEYLGCNKGRLSWNANDEGITDGSIDVIKLATPDGQVPCFLPGSINAAWVND
ncbi:MAG: hypothetical protein R3F12_11955 [Lysobacteraceae bacterium]